ncbi:MAG: NADPH-dependent F420 reductase [Chloroflexi bacterium]|nr:NADPH-dependent F420 reductase [Chloroflexota bacterium]
MLAFLGGTGPEGRGLALRFALAGEEVTIGSRDPDRAREAAQVLQKLAPQASIRGDENREAAKRGDVVFVTVPYEAQKPLVTQLEDELAGKLVINVVAPLAFEKGRPRAVPVEEGSAAMQSQSLLPRSKVVAAFQNLSATELLAPDRAMEGDVVVCSDHQEAKERVMALVGLIKNLRGVDGGGLENARYVEQLTALLLSINRIYKAHSSIRIVGV